MKTVEALVETVSVSLGDIKPVMKLKLLLNEDNVTDFKNLIGKQIRIEVFDAKT